MPFRPRQERTLLETGTVTQRCLKYVYALAGVGAALALTCWLWSGLQHTPYVLFYAAIIFAVRFGGLGPGLCAVVSSALLGEYFLFVPYYSFGLSEGNFLTTSVFVLVGLCIVWLTETAVRARRDDAWRRRWFEATLASIGDGVITTNVDSIVTYLNEPARQLTGWTLQEALGKPLNEVFRLEDSGSKDSLIDPVRTILATGHRQGASIQGELVSRHGSRCPIEESASPIRDVSGVITGAVLIFRDVSERKLTEQAIVELNYQLSARVQELQTILNTAPVGIGVATDPWCENITSNRVLAQMLGMQEGMNSSKSQIAAERLPYRIFRDGVEVPAHNLPMQRAAAEEIAIQGEVLEIVRADKSKITVMFYANPLFNSDGTSRGAVGICVDISAVKRAEKALRENDRRKDEFLAMLAHEIRNPIAAIGNAVALYARSDGAMHAEKVHTVIQRQIKCLSRLVEDLLDVARINRGTVELRCIRMNAVEALRHALQSLQPAIDARGQQVDLNICDQECWIDADPVRLEQVLLNLLSNASKFSPAGGTIWFSLRQELGVAVFLIRDQGMGIDPEELPAMFDLFAQGSRSLARSEGGLGIGLSLVKKLVELHGGSIRGMSEGVGKGSQFEVRLPLSTSEVSEREDGHVVIPHAVGHARILVADDNEDTATLLAMLLRSHGYEVTVANSGPQAVRAAEVFRPHVVLLDVGLPCLDGYEVAKRLRANASFDGIIIAVSGYGRDSDRKRGGDAGFDHYLTKPLDHDALLAIIQSRTIQTQAHSVLLERSKITDQSHP